MGMMPSNALHLATVRRGGKIKSNELIDVLTTQTSYRITRNSSKIEEMKQVSQIDEASSLRIKALEAELMQYRSMLDNMVLQATERLSRRVAILESCNATLGENYHKMHLQYLDLLNRTQAYAAEEDQHTQKSDK